MFDDITPESIKADILGELAGPLDTREGSFADDMAGPLALAIYKLYRDMNRIPDIAWVHEDSGLYLDEAAADVGIEPRKAGEKAKAVLQITGLPGARVPVGKLFCTETGLNFAVTREAVLPESGVLRVPAAAQAVGAGYNVEAGAIVLQYDNDPAITAVCNPEPAEGGTDAENDTVLYRRIVAARQKPSTSGNVYDYERWALEVPGVGAVRVFPLRDGPGTVRVLIVDGEKKPVDAAVIERCAAQIEEKRPIGAAVTVATATECPVSIAADVELDEPLDTVLPRFRDALVEYLSGIAFSEHEILCNRVGALLIRTPGVRDYANLTINGGTGNVALTDEQVPVPGTVTWNEVESLVL